MAGHDAEKATIAPEHKVVLIRINRLFHEVRSEDDLYEVTRKWWKVNPAKRAPDYAFSVYKGIVQAVYRIDGQRWEQRPDDGRWAFRGSVDATLDTGFRGKDVSDYFARGAQNPIKYVNC